MSTHTVKDLASKLLDSLYEIDADSIGLTEREENQLITLLLGITTD